MAETAALLVDDVLPGVPIRQWVLSLPFALSYLLATRPAVITQVLGIVYRAISSHLIRKAGLTRASATTGAVTRSSALAAGGPGSARPGHRRKLRLALHAGVTAKLSQRERLDRLAQG